jgi:hypothetical protein
VGHTDRVLEPTFRPVITVIRITPDRVTVQVSLDLEGRMASGVGEVAGTDTVTAACTGTVAAVQRLLPAHMRVAHEWAQVVDGPDGQQVVNAATRLDVDGTERTEHLLGAAYVRHDVDVAAVRATLDGLTRRLVTYMFD